MISVAHLDMSTQKRFPSESGDILVDALVEEGERIIANLRVSPNDVGGRILSSTSGSDRGEKKSARKGNGR